METITRIAMDKKASDMLVDHIRFVWREEYYAGGMMKFPAGTLASVSAGTRTTGRGGFRFRRFEGVSDGIVLDDPIEASRFAWAKRIARAARGIAVVLRMAPAPRWWTKEQHLVITDSRPSPEDKAWVASTILATAPCCVLRAVAVALAAPEVLVDLLLTTCRLWTVVTEPGAGTDGAFSDRLRRQLGVPRNFEVDIPTPSTIHALAFLAFNPKRVAGLKIARAWRRLLDARRGVDALSGCLGSLGEFTQVLYRHVLPAMLL
jgi:hypothetical protein